jgi:hypothetical protein
MNSPYRLGEVGGVEGAALARLRKALRYSIHGVYPH